jgi:putative spermidine/putrescine transport system substrate-binding protein
MMIMRMFGLFVGSLLFAGFAHSALAQQSDVTLRIATFGGAFDYVQQKYVASVFTARTGIKVEFINGNAHDHLAKLIAAKGREPPFDLVFLDEDVQVQAITAGVLSKMSDSEVPNLKFVYDEIKNKDGYGPGMNLYSCGIAYNVEKFKEAGIPAPTAWADLWNPKLAGRIAVPTLDSPMGHAMLVAAEHLAGGDESTPEKGIAKIAEIKAQSYPASSSTITTLLTSGSVWVVPWLNGRTWGLTDKGMPIAYLLPKEGAFRGLTMMDVVSGTKHRKEALAYVNDVLGPLYGIGIMYEFPYGPPNKLLAPILAAYPEISKKFPATPEDLKQLKEINWTVFNKMLPKAQGLWDREITSKK